MRRETFVFSAAGVLFGLVVGYMAASWDVVPRPAVAGTVGVGTVPGGAASAPPARGAATAKANPDEVKALEALAARQPTDAQSRVELGNLHMDAQQWDEAVRWYREALALDPNRPDVETDLGACLVSSGSPQEALAEFDKALQAKPDYKNALYNKGIALMQLGRPADAAAVWEDLLKRYPQDPQLAGLRARIEQLRAASAPAGK
jgi:tetratricopeptide (TPR) repeat protein